MGDEAGCKRFEQVVRKFLARDIIYIVIGEAAKDPEDAARVRRIYNFMVEHVNNCEKHHNPESVEDGCTRFEAASWLKESILDPLFQRSEEELRSLKASFFEKWLLFQVQHAQQCARHEEEIAGLQILLESPEVVEMHARRIAAEMVMDPATFTQKEQMIIDLIVIGHPQKVDGKDN